MKNFLNAIVAFFVSLNVFRTIKNLEQELEKKDEELVDAVLGEKIAHKFYGILISQMEKEMEGLSNENFVTSTDACMKIGELEEQAAQLRNDLILKEATIERYKDIMKGCEKVIYDKQCEIEKLIEERDSYRDELFYQEQKNKSLLEDNNTMAIELMQQDQAIDAYRDERLQNASIVVKMQDCIDAINVDLLDAQDYIKELEDTKTQVEYIPGPMGPMGPQGEPTGPSPSEERILFLLECIAKNTQKNPDDCPMCDVMDNYDYPIETTDFYNGDDYYTPEEAYQTEMEFPELYNENPTPYDTIAEMRLNALKNDGLI